jgi:esterase/lipase superfamily enzyme
LWDVVRVFYGTDRKRGPQGKRLIYTSDRAGRLELGRADVTVPKAHQVPNIERPFAIRIPFTSVTVYEAAEDPAKHFTIRTIRGLAQDDFVIEVRAQLAKSATFKDRAVVFVHGYNTDFDFALYRTAQMTYDLKFDGAPFLYSWPSASGITGYVSDRDSAEQAEPHLRAFLDLVIRETGAKNVSLIAHSMGNVPLLRVLRDIGPRLPDGVKLDQVILAAPDVDRTVFEQIAQEITKVGRGVTLYASSKDKAMTASRLVSGSPRAGDIPDDGPVIISGIDTIDISSTTMDMLTLGHSLYAERNALLGDISALLQTGLRPPDARMPTLVRVETPKGAYWRVP